MLTRNRFKRHAVTAAALFSALSALAAATPVCEESVVWREGEDGIAFYHVPGICAADNGSIFAYADARYGRLDDFGPHHVVIKKSTDGGKTWGPNRFLGRSEHGEIFLFPNMVQPRGSKRLVFIYSQKDPTAINTRTFVWLRTSDDDGETWTDPKPLHPLLVAADAHLQNAIASSRPAAFAGEDPSLYGRQQFYSGPGPIIQLRRENRVAPSRILVPILAIKNRVGPMARRGMTNTVLYSDDNGATWAAGGTVPANGIAISEPNLVELDNGDILFNSRIEDQPHRAISVSHDGGMTWSPAVIDRSGIPSHAICFASVRRLSFSDPSSGTPSRILYCCPNDPKVRRNETLFVSEDEHQSWHELRVIDSGPSDYSNMAVQGDRILLIYGKLAAKPRETRFLSFNWAWAAAGDRATGPQSAPGGMPAGGK